MSALKHKEKTEDILAISEVYRFPVRPLPWRSKWQRPRVYLLNWQQQKIVRTLNIPQVHFDFEEYQFLDRCYHYSGARGITSNQDCLFIALQNAVLVYALNLKKIVRKIEHPLFNGIHEIVWHEDRLYVTCAVTDSLIAVDENGNEKERFCLGSNQFLLDAFQLPRRELDNRLDYRIMHRTHRLFHINTVQIRNDGIYVNLNRQGSLAKIHPQEQIILRDPGLKESHNAQFSEDGKHILVNDSGNFSLKVYDAMGTLLRSIDIRKFSLPVDFSRRSSFGPSQHAIQAGWLRGLAFSARNKEIAFLGLSPALVFAVNYLTGEFAGFFRFRSDFRISIHGIHNLSRQREGALPE